MRFIYIHIKANYITVMYHPYIRHEINDTVMIFKHTKKKENLIGYKALYCIGGMYIITYQMHFLISHMNYLQTLYTI